MHEHWAAITETPIGRRLSERGRRPALVDLRRVVAVQPHVFTDTDLPELDPADPTAIAAVTLAPPGPMEVETQFDPRRNLWVIHPPSSDFRIARAHRADVEEDGLAFGLEFRFGGSFLKVYRFGDRYLLRDGTHRAVALFARNRGCPSARRRVRAGRRGACAGPAREAIFGGRPPLLPDYLDDAVSAAVELPATRRVILIEGLEVWV